MSFPAYGAAAAFSLIAGAADADYPVANLAGLDDLRAVFSATGALAIGCVLAADELVQIVAICHHNAATTDTYRIRLYSDAGMTALVHDSGVTAFNDGAGGLYPATTPHALAAAVTARAVRIDLSNKVWNIGAVEVAGFWGFTDVGVDREIGLLNQDAITDQLDGADQITAVWSPRTFTGTRKLTDIADVATGLDFLLEKGTDLPFVWVWDADDAATWDRECYVARHVELPTYKKLGHPTGQVPFRHQEHLG